MSGARQFAVLFRKNLLLKTRRPCSTCFEIFLPIVLFALLAYVRSIYEIKTFGPYLFETTPIFPISELMFSAGGSTSRALVDIETLSTCVNSTTCPNKDNVESNAQLSVMDTDGGGAAGTAENLFTTELKNIQKAVVCDSGLVGSVSDALGPLLSMRWPWGGNGSRSESLEEWLRSRDPEECAADIENVILDAQSGKLVDYAFYEAKKLRNEYLASRWKMRAEEVADQLDQQFSSFQFELKDWDPSLNASAPSVVRSRTEGWVEDLCSLKSWNQTMDQGWTWSLADMNWTLNESTITDGLSWLSEALENRRKVDGRSLAADLRRVAMSLFQNVSSNISEVLNTTRLVQELKRLEEQLELSDLLNRTFGLSWNLNETQLAAELEGIADVLDANFGRRFTMDLDTLAGDLVELSRSLESGNLSAWIRGDLVEGLQSLLGWLEDTDMEAEGDRMADQMPEWTNGMVPADMAAMAEDGVWWLSHFVKLGGPVARMLTDMPSVYSTDGAQRSGDGEAANRGYDYDYSEAKEQLADLVRRAIRLTKGGDLSGELDKVLDDVRKRMPEGNYSQALRMSGNYSVDGTGMRDQLMSDLEQLMHVLESGNSNMTWVFGQLRSGLEPNATWRTGVAELLRNLSSTLDSLRNKTEAEIRADVLPIFERDWRASCPSVLNKTAIGQYFERMARGCPKYKQMVRRLREGRVNATGTVREVHEWMEKWDVAKIRKEAERIQNMTKEVDAKAFANATSRVLRKMQERLRSSEQGAAVCLSYASAGCSKLTSEDQCLSSRDGRAPYVDQPCVWCGGRACTSENAHTCEPRDWLLEGEGKSFDTFIAKASYSVATKTCATKDALALELSAEMAAQLDFSCAPDAPPSAAAAGDTKNGGSSKGGLSASSYLQDQLLNRKVLIAPYKGEVKKFWDLVLVEGTQSLLAPPQGGGSEEYQALRSLFRCPLVQAAVAGGMQTLIKDRIMFMDSEEAVEEFARSDADSVLVAIVFKSADPATGNFPAGEVDITYSIRLHAQLLPSTSKIMRISRNAMMGGISLGAQPYLQLFFAHLQEIFGRAAARMQSLRSLEGNGQSELGRNVQANNLTAVGRSISVGVEQFPAPRWSADNFIRIIQYTLPMIMILGWIYAVALLVREIVYEKQERLRDVMRIMGLKTWVYWASWMASAMVQMLVLVTFMTAILCGSKVMKHSDPTVIWCFFALFSMATVSLSLLISSFFSRAKVAAACGGLIYYVLYMPYSFFNRYDDTMGTNGKNLMCLMSSTGLGVGSAMIAKWEVIEEGVQWDNLFNAPPVTYSGQAPTDDHSFGHVWMMLVIDTILYQVLAWYIEKVCPGTLGLPQPWYFPLLPSFWRPKATTFVENDSAELGTTAEQADNSKLECWEAPPVGTEVTVQIRQLSKTFRNGKKALSGVSLDMHRGTIVGYLGHNGAGKSTTMSILTGLYPPSKGDVQVNGVSVCKDSLGVRRQLGVCLQHNALYENITVQEHLQIFCCLKAVPWDKMKEEVNGLLRDTGLEAKRNFPTRALSGGMKRKLSIAIALAGGSSVITLDEPTAGVDATSRRDIWQLLAKHKAGRTILLSTHFMDEADILSDRIAIIAEGQLTAIGSSLSLKRKFADGYMLTVVCNDGADTHKLNKAITGSVPGARCVGGRGREIGFCLPFGSQGRFAELFQQLQNEDVRASMGVDSYGLSAATMEEVFLAASSTHEAGLHGRVRNAIEVVPNEEDSTNEGSSNSGSNSDKCAKVSPHPSVADAADVALSLISKPPSEEASDENDRPRSPQCMGEGFESPRVELPNKDSKRTVSTDVGSPQSPGDASPLSDNEEVTMAVKTLSGAALWFHQFDALFRKRFLSVRRDRRAWASQLLLPALFVLIALVVARILSVQAEEPPLKLSSDMFLGSVSAGAVTTSMDKNLWHMTGPPSDALAQRVEGAFSALGDAGNDYQYFSEDNTTTLSEYYMYEARSMNENGGITFRSSEGEGLPSMTLWFKNQAYHIVPVMVNMWNNARFRLMGFQEAKIEVWSHPLPKTQALLQEEMSGSSQIFTDLTVAITVILAMGFIPASFVVYLVHEKSTSGKHQQLLTGITPMMYWLNSYAWDIFNYLVPLVCCGLIFAIFRVDAYSGSNLPAVLVLLFCYGLCMTPAMYCLEPAFSVASTAYVTLIVTNIFTGTLSVLATSVMDGYQGELPQLKPINDFCKAVFPWMLPNYSLGRGMINIATNHYMNYAAEEFGVCVHDRGTVCFKNPLAWGVTGKLLFCLFATAPLWLMLRLLIEWGFCTRGLRQRAAQLLSSEARRSVDNEDPAVAAEARRVDTSMQAAKASGSSVADHLVITDLSKTFVKRRCGLSSGKPFHAVRGITCGVPAGECFGLLGVNGAGKTTTMRMITGDTDITHGDILVGGWSVRGQRDRARQHLGYCPQFDALPDKLTVRETLALYARIRGVPTGSVWTTVENMVRKMCLEAHQKQLCENLSGGNKRKLSTALALIGSPDVVLLDEPSTGVDVGARRFLWEVISNVRLSGHAVVLTSHSMEECEVLCTRLTIMVHGQLRCLGSPMELKNKFGGGYTMAVKANQKSDQFSGAACAADPCDLIRTWVAKEVALAKLTEESVGLFRYRLGIQGQTGQMPLAEIFQKFEEATKEGGPLAGCISDYSLSQTSLEEVFLHFSQVGEREFAAKEGRVIELPAAAVLLPESSAAAAAAGGATDDVLLPMNELLSDEGPIPPPPALPAYGGMSLVAPPEIVELSV